MNPQPKAPVVLMTLRRLPTACQPVHVHEAFGMTMVAVDPRFDMLAVVTWCADNLTLEEQNAFRDALGEPRVGEGAASDDLTDPDVHMSWGRIPDSLLTPRGRAQKATALARLAAAAQSV